MHLDRDPIF